MKIFRAVERGMDIPEDSEPYWYFPEDVKVIEENVSEEKQDTENVSDYEELKKLPAKPGVYLMHDERDEMIYVGKAVGLKTVLRQYVPEQPLQRCENSSRWSPILQDLNISLQIPSWKHFLRKVI